MNSQCCCYICRRVGRILTKLDNLEVECDLIPILEDLAEINTKMDLLIIKQDLCCEKINSIYNQLPELKCRFPRPDDDK